eukprot:1318654-Prymnesium_polylepis.1
MTDGDQLVGRVPVGGAVARAMVALEPGLGEAAAVQLVERTAGRVAVDACTLEQLSARHELPSCMSNRDASGVGLEEETRLLGQRRLAGP